MRNYKVMREVLARASNPRDPLYFDDFYGIEPREALVNELVRLGDYGLFEGGIGFSKDGICTGGTVKGLSEEGRDFYRLLENDKVWCVIYGVLDKAGIDLYYPLLKEVCEEIVKRYVTSFIPEIKSK